MSEKIHFEPTWELPNPFYKADGSIMSTKAEWEEKRKAYLELLSEMYYGKMPGRPQTLTASELSNETICQNTFKLLARNRHRIAAKLRRDGKDRRQPAL